MRVSSATLKRAAQTPSGTPDLLCHPVRERTIYTSRPPTCGFEVRTHHHRRQRAPPLPARPTGVWQALSAVSCLVAGGTSCCRCGAFVSSLSEHVSPEQSGGVPLAGLGPHIDLQPVVRSSSNFAARVGRRISVLMWGSNDGAVLPSTPVV